MLASLLKDMSDVGSLFGKEKDEMKVKHTFLFLCLYCTVIFQL